MSLKSRKNHFVLIKTSNETKICIANGTFWHFTLLSRRINLFITGIVIGCFDVLTTKEYISLVGCQFSCCCGNEAIELRFVARVLKCFTQNEFIEAVLLWIQRDKNSDSWSNCAEEMFSRQSSRPYTVGSFRMKLTLFEQFIQEFTYVDEELNPEERQQILQARLTNGKFPETVRLNFVVIFPRDSIFSTEISRKTNRRRVICLRSTPHFTCVGFTTI